jgi:uncharacterized repeat protein (TIGR02543 family)
MTALPNGKILSAGGYCDPKFLSSCELFDPAAGNECFVQFAARIPEGAIIGTAKQTIMRGGSTVPVTAVPSIGYKFVNWTGDGGFATSTSNPLTVTNVQSDMIIVANFTQSNGRLVIFLAGSGGTISGVAAQSVEDGGSTTAVTGTPGPGYSLSPGRFPERRHPASPSTYQGRRTPPARPDRTAHT